MNVQERRGKRVDKRKKAGEWIITVLTVCAVLMLAVPLLIGAGYTYPQRMILLSKVDQPI